MITKDTVWLKKSISGHYVDANREKQSNEGIAEAWCEDIKKYKIRRVEWLRKSIEHYDNEIERLKRGEFEEGENPEEVDTAILMFRFFVDELKVDLREDLQLIEYEGKIPEVIEKRAMKKSEKMYERWRTEVGGEKARWLHEQVAVYLWGDILADDAGSVGGGKIV